MSITLDDASKNIGALKHLKEKYGLLQKTFSEKAVDKGLFSIVTNSLQRVISSGPEDGITSKKLVYLKRLIEELIRTGNEEVDLEKKVQDVLLYLNFNSRKYFLYCIDQINQELNEEETLTGKLERLAYRCKVINQVQCESNISYTTKYPSLKEVIGNWISEEMNYLDTKRQLTMTFPAPENPLKKDFKVSLNLSVTQFACLIRSLSEERVILNKNLTELAGFFARTVETKRSENISEGSFRRKYYNIEDSAKKSVIDMLNRTIDWLARN